MLLCDSAMLPYLSLCLRSLQVQQAKPVKKKKKLWRQTQQDVNNDVENPLTDTFFARRAINKLWVL